MTFNREVFREECPSAWGPDADRQAKPLIYRAVKGSILGSDSHPIAGSTTLPGTDWQTFPPLRVMVSWQI